MNEYEGTVTLDQIMEAHVRIQATPEKRFMFHSEQDMVSNLIPKLTPEQGQVLAGMVNEQRIKFCEDVPAGQVFVLNEDDWGLRP